MEQTVWIYIGIITALIGLGLIISLVNTGMENTKTQVIANSLESLQVHCDRICDSEIGTKLSTRVTLVAGIKLFAAAKGVCISYREKTDCRDCGCIVKATDENTMILDLDTPEAFQLFDSHAYQCSFEKTSENLIAECKG